MSKPLHVAIDGPAASGKTTVGRATARRLGVFYLDTGAMYRALSYLALVRGTEADNPSALRRLCDDDGIGVSLDPEAHMGFRIFAGGSELSERTLQSTEVTAIVSTVASHPIVREAMVAKQRALASGSAVVMAGRDIGTVVLPDAQVKIFLTASVSARIDRRREQLERAGIHAMAAHLAEEIEERDRLDRTRPVAPLVPAEGAHVIDSSELSVVDVVNRIASFAERANA